MEFFLVCRFQDTSFDFIAADKKETVHAPISPPYSDLFLRVSEFTIGTMQKEVLPYLDGKAKVEKIPQPLLSRAFRVD